MTTEAAVNKIVQAALVGATTRFGRHRAVRCAPDAAVRRGMESMQAYLNVALAELVHNIHAAGANAQAITTARVIAELDIAEAGVRSITGRPA